MTEREIHRAASIEQEQSEHRSASLQPLDDRPCSAQALGGSNAKRSGLISSGGLLNRGYKLMFFDIDEA